MIVLFVKQPGNKYSHEVYLQVARAILGGPDLKLFEDKINIIAVIKIKDRTNRI